MGNSPELGNGRQHTIAIASKHQLLRRGLELTIGKAPDLVVCACAANADQLRMILEQQHPELSIVDMNLERSDADTRALVREICAAAHPTLVIDGLEDDPSPDRARQCLECGACGYFHKQQAPADIVHAVHTVLKGRRYMRADLAESVHDASEMLDPASVLTPRQLEVFTMIGEGWKHAEITEKLNLSRKTIDSHKEKIKERLNLSDAAKLARAAVRYCKTRSQNIDRQQPTNGCEQKPAALSRDEQLLLKMLGQNASVMQIANRFGIHERRVPGLLQQLQRRLRFPDIDTLRQQAPKLAETL